MSTMKPDAKFILLYTASSDHTDHIATLQIPKCGNSTRASCVRPSLAPGPQHQPLAGAPSAGEPLLVRSLSVPAALHRPAITCNCRPRVASVP